MLSLKYVRMAERSKALRSGRSPLLWAWVQIPLLTNTFYTEQVEDCLGAMITKIHPFDQTEIYNEMNFMK